MPRAGHAQLVGQTQAHGVTAAGTGRDRSLLGGAQAASPGRGTRQGRLAPVQLRNGRSRIELGQPLEDVPALPLATRGRQHQLRGQQLHPGSPVPAATPH